MGILSDLRKWNLRTMSKSTYILCHCYSDDSMLNIKIRNC